MKKLIEKNLEQIKHNNTAESFVQICDVIDMNAIFFCTWLDMLLEEDPDWFKHNTISMTYVLFKSWQLKDDGDVE